MYYLQIKPQKKLQSNCIVKIMIQRKILFSILWSYFNSFDSITLKNAIHLQKTILSLPHNLYFLLIPFPRNLKNKIFYFSINLKLPFYLLVAQQGSSSKMRERKKKFNRSPIVFDSI